MDINQQGLIWCVLLTGEKHIISTLVDFKKKNLFSLDTLDRSRIHAMFGAVRILCFSVSFI